LAGPFVKLSALAILRSADAKFRCRFMAWRVNLRPVRWHSFRVRPAISLTSSSNHPRPRRNQAGRMG